MNLKKVEQILIVAFVILNIVLALLLFQRDQQMNITSTAETLSVTEVMSRDEIRLPEFQESELALPYIQAAKTNALDAGLDQLEGQTATTDPDGYALTSILSNPMEIERDNEFTLEEQELITNFKDGGGVLYGEDYQLFRADSINGFITYTQVVDGVPVADGTASLTFSLNEEGEIISYHQRYIGEVSKQGDPVNLITDRRSVELLYQNNKIPTGASVAAPRLVYFQTLDLEDSAIYVPAWYVEVISSSSREYFYVDATNGVISTTLPVQETEEES